MVQLWEGLLKFVIRVDLMVSVLRAGKSENRTHVQDLKLCSFLFWSKLLCNFLRAVKAGRDRKMGQRRSRALKTQMHLEHSNWGSGVSHPGVFALSDGGGGSAEGSGIRCRCGGWPAQATVILCPAKPRVVTEAGSNTSGSGFKKREQG